MSVIQRALPRLPMSLFYAFMAGREYQYRIDWMQRARKHSNQASRADCARFARQSNHRMVRFLKEAKACQRK